MTFTPLFIPTTTSTSPKSSLLNSSPILIQEHSPITHLTFYKNKFAFSSSTKIQIYSNLTLSKTISRFKQPCYSPNYRSDGQLIVAGDASGLVQVFDINTRAILRSFSGHEGPVMVSRFTPDHSRILSASDDKTIRLWDISSQSNISTFDEHQDYVRSAVIGNNLIFSGSYDHTIKAWDYRSKNSVMTWDAGAPVESLVLLPGNGILAAASGSKVKLFDVLSQKIIHSMANYSKTVSCMALNQQQNQLITCSLDHHLKIIDLHDYKIVNSVKYPAPILSVGISDDSRTLAVGMSNGLLSIRHSANKQKVTIDEKMRRGSWAYFMRGSKYDGSLEDTKIVHAKPKKLAKYDYYLKSFQYGNALDAVLKTQSPPLVTSLLKELIHRDGLSNALGGRDEKSLEPIMIFLFKNIDTPNYSSMLVDVANMILEMYGSVMTRSLIISELLFKLQKNTKNEIKVQKKMIQTLGLLESLFAC